MGLQVAADHEQGGDPVPHRRAELLGGAGPHVAGSLVRSGLADRVLFLLSPIAGGDGPPALDGVAKPADLRDVRIRRMGADLAVEGALA